MPLITSALLALNPDIEKYSYTTLTNYSIEHVSDFEEIDDLKNAYFLYNKKFSSKIELIKEQLNSFLINSDVDLKISSDVYNNSYSIIEELYPSIYDSLSLDDIYPSNYGTLIFDWEKENGDIFSLEIGSESLGYFIEVDGRDQKQIDEITIEDSLNVLLKDLSIFLFE